MEKSLADKLKEIQKILEEITKEDEWINENDNETSTQKFLEEIYNNLKRIEQKCDELTEKVQKIMDSNR